MSSRRSIRCTRDKHAHRLRRGTRREALTAAAAAIAEATPWSDTWTAASARIDLRPWQLEPALAVIHGATRVLLADAVGLGKTIQALLIVTELVARGMARRVLVLTPASLRDQWAGEASQRFGLTATVFDHATLACVRQHAPDRHQPVEHGGADRLVDRSRQTWRRAVVARRGARSTC